MSRSKSFLSRNEERLWRDVMLIALFALTGLLTLTSASIVDADVWSHVRTGQWIVENRSVPYADSFSAYGMGKPWFAYSWLFELLVYSLFSRLGLMGLLLYVYGLVLLITAVLHALLRKLVTEVHAAILTGLAIFAMLPLYTPRPWLFTILLFTIELNVLISVRHSRNYGALFFLPLLYALWANLHIQFVYGFFLLGIAACEAPISKLLRRPLLSDANVDPGLPPIRMVLIMVGCVIATLANPYHFRIYAVVLDYVRQPGLYNLFREYVAMDFRTAPNWFVLFLTLGATFALSRRHITSLFLILLLAAGVLVSFRSGRDVWFVAIVGVVTISSSCSKALAGSRIALHKIDILVISAAVCVLLFLTARVRHISEGDLQNTVARSYPVEAANIIEKRGYTGPLYNHYDWGGYLIWRLPRMPVSIDGRTNVHDVARVIQSLAVWNGKHDWASDPELSAAHVVIAQRDLPLTQLLRLDQRFEIVYEDQVAVVFIAKIKD